MFRSFYGYLRHRTLGNGPNLRGWLLVAIVTTIAILIALAITSDAGAQTISPPVQNGKQAWLSYEILAFAVVNGFAGLWWRSRNYKDNVWFYLAIAHIIISPVSYLAEWPINGTVERAMFGMLLINVMFWTLAYLDLVKSKLRPGLLGLITIATTLANACIMNFWVIGQELW